MPEEKKRSGHKLSAWVSDKLYDDLQALGYFGRQISQSEALTRALELYSQNHSRETNGRYWEMSGRHRATNIIKREIVGDWEN
jgi:hypothetical protein